MATRKIIRPAASGNTGTSAAPATASAAAPAPASARTLNLSEFVEQLRKQTDSARVQKATSMLQSDRFQLFDEVSDEHVTGVVKSQTDYSLFYACKLDKHGNFMCCTQNLNRCGGLSGNKPCKHMLVLMIGLVQGGKMNANQLSEWTKAAKA
ncbi:MAG TPA: hypothetical protein VEU33_29955, partial [Archangium sp.]|nr:hypothetical protein [Archangium sp.]